MCVLPILTNYISEIIKIMVFPLDNSIVFGDNFFSLADKFFYINAKRNPRKKNCPPTNQVTHLTETLLYFTPLIWDLYASPTKNVCVIQKIFINVGFWVNHLKFLTLKYSVNFQISFEHVNGQNSCPWNIKTVISFDCGLPDDFWGHLRLKYDFFLYLCFCGWNNRS